VGEENTSEGKTDIPYVKRENLRTFRRGVRAGSRAGEVDRDFPAGEKRHVAASETPRRGRHGEAKSFCGIRGKAPFLAIERNNKGGRS